MDSWHTVSLCAADTNCETHVGPPTGKSSPINVLYEPMSLLSFQKGLDDWRVIEGGEFSPNRDLDGISLPMWSAGHCGGECDLLCIAYPCVQSLYSSSLSSDGLLLIS